MSTRPGDRLSLAVFDGRSRAFQEPDEYLVGEQPPLACQANAVLRDLEEAAPHPVLDGRWKALNRLRAELFCEGSPAHAVDTTQAQGDGLEGARGLRQDLRPARR